MDPHSIGQLDTDPDPGGLIAKMKRRKKKQLKDR
jgi:hypothetical protein